jgi:hypothetical protein
VGLYDFGSKHHQLHHVLFHEAGFSEEDAFTAVRDALVDLIEEGVASGELAISDVGLGRPSCCTAFTVRWSTLSMVANVAGVRRSRSAISSIVCSARRDYSAGMLKVYMRSASMRA